MEKKDLLDLRAAKGYTKHSFIQFHVFYCDLQLLSWSESNILCGNSNWWHVAIILIGECNEGLFFKENKII